MLSGKELTLQELLEIENDPAILEFRCQATGIPLWPQIRLAFFRLLMGDLLYDTPITGVSNSPTSSTRAVSYMSRALLHNARMRLSAGSRARVCVMADGIADQWRGGQLFNRLGDYFALSQAEQTVSIQDHFEWRWPFPRHHRRILFHAPAQATNAIVGRLRARPGHHQVASKLVRLVCERAQRRHSWAPGPERERQLIESLARKAASLPWQYANYESMLERIRPEKLLVGTACYGAAAAVLMTAANRAGIQTAEYQHGAISGGHDGYNFAPIVRDSAEYRDTLPRHFLSYGAWWGEQINAPLNTVIIGNPHREEMLAQVDAKVTSREDVLILSDGMEFSKYLDLARQIAPTAARKGLRVVLRPHPLERTLIKSTLAESVAGVAIDGNVDLYASLRSAHAVVSEVSTGLFEAIGLADKQFMWDTAKARFGYPRHPFQSFDSAAMLLDMLMQDGAGRPAAPAAAIWATPWRQNYLQFLGTGARQP